MNLLQTSYNKEYSKSTFIPSFVGVFPCDSPKLVCAISLYRPSLEYKWASSEAVPAVKNIFKQILIKDKDLSIELANEFK